MKQKGLAFGLCYLLLIGVFIAWLHHQEQQQQNRIDQINSAYKVRLDAWFAEQQSVLARMPTSQPNGRYDMAALAQWQADFQKAIRLPVPLMNFSE